MTVGRSAPGARPAAGRRRAEPVRRKRTLGAPRPISLRTRGWRYGVIGAAILLLLGWVLWYATTPEDLPTTDKVVSASGVTGTPLYVGMFTAPDDFGRTLRISGVKVRATSNTDITITPVLCRRGNVGVTTQPDQFCSDIVDPEGARMVGGDSIMLKVESADPAVGVIERVRVAFREDIRWDTKPAGHQQAIVTMAGRPTAQDAAG